MECIGKEAFDEVEIKDRNNLCYKLMETKTTMLIIRENAYVVIILK